MYVYYKMDPFFAVLSDAIHLLTTTFFTIEILFLHWQFCSVQICRSNELINTATARRFDDDGLFPRSATRRTKTRCVFMTVRFLCVCSFASSMHSFLPIQACLSFLIYKIGAMASNCRVDERNNRSSD